jgi:hypothetical protein
MSRPASRSKRALRKLVKFASLCLDAAGDPDELRDLVAEPLAWLRNSPAYRKTEYDSIRSKDCVRFDMESADISAQEMQVYAELVAMGGAVRE